MVQAYYGNVKKMKTEKEIQEKLVELNKRMAKLLPSDMFGVASTDGQRFIIQWVLDIE